MRTSAVLVLFFFVNSLAFARLGRLDRRSCGSCSNDSPQVILFQNISPAPPIVAPSGCALNTCAKAAIAGSSFPLSLATPIVHAVSGSLLPQQLPGGALPAPVISSHGSSPNAIDNSEERPFAPSFNKPISLSNKRFPSSESLAPSVRPNVLESPFSKGETSNVSAPNNSKSDETAPTDGLSFEIKIHTKLASGAIFGCHATMISNTGESCDVLTAAHCMADSEEAQTYDEPFKVQLANLGTFSAKLIPNPQYISQFKALAPTYDSQSGNTKRMVQSAPTDIALIHLQGDACKKAQAQKTPVVPLCQKAPEKNSSGTAWSEFLKKPVPVDIRGNMAFLGQGPEDTIHTSNAGLRVGNSGTGLIVKQNGENCTAGVLRNADENSAYFSGVSSVDWVKKTLKSL